MPTRTAADLASDDQDATKVSSFLKATITVDDATGETAVVSDYVAQKTLENLESYAAIETRFDELGGVLTLDGGDPGRQLRLPADGAERRPLTRPTASASTPSSGSSASSSRATTCSRCATASTARPPSPTQS